ncbi:MAG TPA: nickel pincer cofactor biosynthesis protein LarC [Gaiellaceae bacterium]
MNRVAYLDCVGGLAGDMFVAALLDAGGDVDVLRRVPSQLGLRDVEIAVEEVERGGLRALHVRVCSGTQPPRRSWLEIRSVVLDADLAGDVRTRVLAVLTRLAEAEARVHGVAPEEVHFHELGDVDTLIDVCGAVSLLSDLQVERVVCSPLPIARGFIASAHGLLPLPAPATAELLRGVSVVGVEGEGETVTPTGVALASVLADSFGSLPPLVVESVGYGAGSNDPSERPNVVRVLLSTPHEISSNGEVSLLETNVDDMSPELVPDAVERCFDAGALDVWTVPAQMKKGRPGLVMSALVRPSRESSVARVLLEETSAIGIRVSRLRRYELEREERKVIVEGGTVRIKIARLDGGVVNVAPEHDDCAEIAKATGRSVKAIWIAALSAAETL